MKKLFSRVTKRFQLRSSNEMERAMVIIAQERIDEARNQRLEELDLSGLGLRTGHLRELIPAIATLPALTSLDLSENRFKALPHDIYRMENLRVLSVRNNRITRLSPEIGNMTNLAELDVRANRLTNLPPEMCLLKNLSNLDAARNQLKTMPTELGNLVNLQELNLKDNHLTALPQSTGDLHRLNKMDLSDNQIRVLPHTMSGMSELAWLDISGNQIEALPEGIGYLPNLTSLRLPGNQLRDLPESFNNLSGQLVMLKVGGNLLSEEAKHRLVNNFPKALIAIMDVPEVIKSNLAMLYNHDLEFKKVAHGLKDVKLDPVRSIRNGKEEYTDAKEVIDGFLASLSLHSEQERKRNGPLAKELITSLLHEDSTRDEQQAALKRMASELGNPTRLRNPVTNRRMGHTTEDGSQLSARAETQAINHIAGPELRSPLTPSSTLLPVTEHKPDQHQHKGARPKDLAVGGLKSDDIFIGFRQSTVVSLRKAQSAPPPERQNRSTGKEPGVKAESKDAGPKAPSRKR